MMGTSKHSIDIDLQLTTESAGIRKGGRLTALSPHLRHTQQILRKDAFRSRPGGSRRGRSAHVRDFGLEDSVPVVDR